MSETRTSVTVSAVVNAPEDYVWKCLTEPEHITQWNFAIDSWHCPSAEIDLRVDGKFSYRMEARDGSMGFDFWGTFTRVEPAKALEFTLGDGRLVSLLLENSGNTTTVTETFECEAVNPVEMQRGGWQMILNNFASHTERSYNAS